MSAYGLGDAAADNPDFLTLWKKAQEDFRRSFQEYLTLLGVVTREDYAALEQENAGLKEKLAEQEETIKRLRTLAEEKGLGLEAATLEFQKLVEKQGDQFQKLIQGLGEAAQSAAPPEGEKT
jgi:BMFP domain-containing protein YqiC